MGGFGSGRTLKDYDKLDVGKLMRVSYRVCLMLMQDESVSKEKRLEVASRMASRIIPERMLVDVKQSLTDADRDALIASLRFAMRSIPAPLEFTAQDAPAESVQEKNALPDTLSPPYAPAPQADTIPAVASPEAPDA